MRRFIKPALVTLGAAAAAFVVVNSASLNPTPVAKSKTFCSGEMARAKIVQTTLVPFDFPTLPTIPPSASPTIPCIPVPTHPTVTTPSLPKIVIPPVVPPTVVLPKLPVIEIPDIFPTTSTTQWTCTISPEAVVSAAC